MPQPCIVLTTTSSRDSAERLSRVLVEEYLAACCSIIGGARSIYRWKGEIAEDDEHVILIKTVAERYAELEARIRELHSYEVPEIIRLPIEGGSDSYLEWLFQATTPVQTT